MFDVNLLLKSKPNKEKGHGKIVCLDVSHYLCDHIGALGVIMAGVDPRIKFPLITKLD